MWNGATKIFANAKKFGRGAGATINAEATACLSALALSWYFVGLNRLWQIYV